MDTPFPKPPLTVRFTEQVLRFRWTVIAVSLAIVGLMAWGGKNLGFEGSYRAFFSERNPQLLAFEELQNVYTKKDNVFFAIAPKNGDVFTRETLAAVEDLTERSWQIPFTTRVDSISNFQHTEAEGDDLIVEDLVVDSLSLSDREIASIRAVALTEPLLVNRLVSEEGHVTAVNATLQFDGSDPKELAQVVEFVRNLSEDFRADHPGVDLYASGVVMINNAFVETSMKDMGSLVPLMYLTLIFLIALLLRSVASTLATVAVIVLSTAAAMGVAGWLGILLTPPSSLAPTMITTLAVADSIHILTTLLSEMRKGTRKREAIIEAIRVNAQPVFLTSLTTVIGFLAMNFSDVPPYNDLGNITAVGVSVAFALSMTLVPAMFSVIPFQVRRAATASDARYEALATFVITNRRTILWVTTAAALAIALFIPANELDDHFTHYFDDRIQFRTDNDFIAENLTGPATVDFSLSAAGPSGISDPAYLRKVDEFAEWWREQPETVHVATITDVFKRLNMNMHGDDPSEYRLPEERDLAAQYLLLYELSLPFGLDLNDQINVDKSATRFTVTLDDITAVQSRQVTERAEAWLRQNAPEYMHSVGSGPWTMFSHISKRSINSMFFGTALALLLITGCLAIALRSVRYGLVSLIPNIVPAALAFGAWGVLVGRVGFGLSIVVAMTLGIVVDDSVHFLSKYIRGRREHGLDPEDAVRYAFTMVGRALVTTTVILVGGFLVLCTSAFAQNAEMGQMTVITILFALVADFFLLPTILLTFDGRQENEAIGVESLPNAA